ncbi:Oidioi.mRNA.OKI2018_I69.chr2.g4374.t1.cds [Oikopleura dioica]|uniref:Oidioi.mRNA.OKI2018_I69.chr2.g4374.t1.cds n=1 Tax=Oikopleura dioica TaxID=34765 RepID=A0ABN7SWW0_OIKDI|nr:Oidioi.mRNA.OKI2018_I69.chr2.g4374.t1.cds [Oikopleura dioica]
MKNIISTIFVALANGEKFGSSEVSKDLKFGWDLKNNCGPRPQGPRYPEPPVASSGDPNENKSCDIITDAQYISGYKCEAPCQADQEIVVEINCNCHTSMGPLQFIKQCEWEFVDGKKCPSLKPFQKEFDWECDPRFHNCPGPQYRSVNRGPLASPRPAVQSTRDRPAFQPKIADRGQRVPTDQEEGSLKIEPIGDHGDLITQKEKVNGTTSITNIIDFAPVFSKLFHGLEEGEKGETEEYNQPRKRSLRDHYESEYPDYDMNYYGDFSTQNIFKQITKESLNVQRRLARTIAQRNHLRHVKESLTKKLESVLDLVTEYEGSSGNEDLATLIAEIQAT